MKHEFDEYDENIARTKGKQAIYIALAAVTICALILLAIIANQ